MSSKKKTNENGKDARRSRRRSAQTRQKKKLDFLTESVTHIFETKAHKNARKTLVLLRDDDTGARRPPPLFEEESRELFREKARVRLFFFLIVVFERERRLLER